MNSVAIAAMLLKNNTLQQPPGNVQIIHTFTTPIWMQIIIIKFLESMCLKTGLSTCQQTRYVEPMVVQFWASVADGGPALNQHWVDVSCLCGPDKPHCLLFIYNPNGALTIVCLFINLNDSPNIVQVDEQTSFGEPPSCVRGVDRGCCDW